MLVAAAGNDGATGGRFGTIASPAASPGWLAVGASDGRSALPTVDVALGTNGIQTGVDAVPLLGALSPKSDTPMPLVLPAGPTKSDGARAPADVVAGTDEGDFRATDGTSLVSGKAVLLPRDGAPIAQRAAAAGAAGASALVLYGDGGAPAGALGLDDRVKLPIAVLPGDQGATAAATLLTGGAVTITFSTTHSDDNPQAGSVAAFSSTGLAFDDSIKPDLVAPGVAVTTSAPGRRATWPRAARPWPRRRSPASWRSCSRRIPPGRRGSCAARSSARPRPWAATATARLPVEAQGGRRRRIPPAPWRPRWSPSRRR